MARCERCGTAEEPLTPAKEAVAELVGDHLPGTDFDELCANLWLLELLIFVCKNNPVEGVLCPTCHSAKH